MSSPELEIVRDLHDGFARTGAFDLTLFDPDVELDNSTAVMDAAVYRGRDGIEAFLILLREMWMEVRIEPEEFLEREGGRVLVPFRMTMVGRDEIETVAQAAALYTVSDGRIIRVEAFQSREQALEAMG